MNSLPFLLGSHCAVSVGSYSNELKEHFLKLSYKVIVETTSYALMSDNSLKILLTKDDTIPNNKYCLVYFTNCLSEKIYYLKQNKIAYNNVTAFNKKAIYINIAHTIEIYIIEEDIKLKENAKQIMLNELNPQKPEQYPFNSCGLFGELSYSLDNLRAILTTLKQLGFRVSVDTDGQYPWAILSDGLTIIGLHQTTNFSSATVTYFAYDMKDRLKQLRHTKGLNLTEVKGLSPKKAAKIISPNKLEYFLFTI